MKYMLLFTRTFVNSLSRPFFIFTEGTIEADSAVTLDFCLNRDGSNKTLLTNLFLGMIVMITYKKLSCTQFRCHLNIYTLINYKNLLFRIHFQSLSCPVRHCGAI